MSLPAAWNRFRDKMEELRLAVENDVRFGLTPMAQAQAYNYLYQIQALAYNMAISPRPDHPRFWTQQLFEPIYSWLAPNPDFIYSRTIVNPKRSWKISGRVGGTAMVVFQKQSMLFGYGMQRLGSQDMRDFAVDANGRFEITASAKKPASGNWIELHPEFERNIISVRRALPSFDVDVGEIHIEALDGNVDEPFEREPESLAALVDYACEMVDFTTRKITMEIYSKTIENAGWNQPWIWGSERSAGQTLGGADLAIYAFMVFDIASDEALIVDMEVPDCLYWGAQLSDVWWQTLDYAWFQSSLSMGQAKRDADGHVRYVVSAVDPGVANWLDTVGGHHGGMLMRWYDAEHRPNVQVQKVKRHEIDALLPADTNRVTPEVRKANLAARQRDVYRIYGN